MASTAVAAAARVGLPVEEMSRALASYVRTILAADSPFDRFIAGDRGALSEKAQAGLAIFRGKGNCSRCHVGPTLTDEAFHDTGIAWQNGRSHDEGRYEITRIEGDRRAFKTPTLREVARTAPYMHDGSIASLREVVDYYDRGGNADPHRDPEIRPLRLAAPEKEALRAFLESLSGRIEEGGR